MRRCSEPIFLTDDGSSSSRRGAVVVDIRLNPLFEIAGKNYNLSPGNSPNQSGPVTRSLIVLDSSGQIIYHPNIEFRYQTVKTAIPAFSHVADLMMARQQRGTELYPTAEGETWIAAYQPIDISLSLAVAGNYSLATQNSRRIGWLSLTLSTVFGFIAALLLTAYFQRKTEAVGRLSETVAAIAGGNFTQRAEAPTGDDMRPIADSVNVIGDRLREQLAREAEERQFQSFVKLSALLTHDLKNAIEALSLTVSNMDRHFDNPEFRRDAMSGLASATEKLRALVARVSNPVNTLSGEFKLPRPTDLVPLLRRVLSQIAAPLSSKLDIEVKLPVSLFAMVDGERIEKVMENLVLNAIESMSGKGGKLTVAAGTTTGAKIFFSVTDTGIGMNSEFVPHRLFRPFATTKKSGVGLGLYTCREVVRANAGTIEVDSVEGSGTTFRVVLASAQPKERA